MVRFLIVLSLILSALPIDAAQASNRVNWRDLEVQSLYQLAEPIILENRLVLPRASQVVLTLNTTLDAIKVEYYEFKFSEGCPANLRGKKSDIIIHKEMWGFNLSADCTIGVFAELKDLFSESVFTKSEVTRLTLKRE